MATISLLVRSSPFAGDHHYIAMDFIRAAVASGHTIRRVFFYQDAVYAALNSQQPVQGQTPLASQWSELAADAGFPLQVCIANALRRGIADEAEQKRYGLNALTCAGGFELAGLGEMAEAAADSDRVVEF
ncbi:sulfurtransferase complex subunit TusD [Thalassolituus sp. LLYu03]|uniref:sulfurtransferase complex subunit TusD n=1 Tax=Thalassolituus sp. LLYu03 TaxID=3421656 RepID=UPI003D298E39